MKQIKNGFQKVTGYVRSSDSISDPGYNFFHYDGDVSQKTLLGGVGAIAVNMVVSYIAISKGHEMITHQNPEVSSIESSVTQEDNVTLKLNETIQPLFHIWKGGDNPFDTVELDRESRKYIHVRLNNVV